ncbi:carboxypeptidase-like regulatory domain-containing protein [Hymenobacter arizonensis]|uniref:CarboxypepD_reg-like domain-containing protein n=1 Tax=Hymenobacter arizonensis TaxID=1227077 RepID=A0A1I5TKF4_HYMAR|nr:carboxypeptidase-like regulatory domain-containing protein [Hymenobacter arizonensis]SFP83530.1 CarboxypepD_reg-like domain-containing protein [Hymenobacter arizonensis]
MSQENLPKVEEQPYDPNLDAQDEDVVSGGNNRLTYVLVAVVLALVVGYLMLPKGSGGGMASATPSFLLDDAAVTATATAPTSADSIAAGLKSATVAAAKQTEETTSKSSDKAAASAKITAPVSTVALVTPTAAPVQAPEPEVAEVAPSAPEPAAPSNVTLTGRILDESGRPMVGATVLLKGSSKGTSTDANGSYALEVPGGNDHSLIFGYGGYDDEVVHVSGSRPVNVTLTPRAKSGRKRR